MCVGVFENSEHGRHLARVDARGGEQVEQADAIVDGPFGQKLHARLADKGIVGLAYTELGFRNLTNSKKPINTVEDIAGLKLRVIPNAINIDWVKALGANPTPMAFPEVYAGLEQKAIDGQENPLSVILANKFYEVQKYISFTAHKYEMTPFVMSKRSYDKMSEADRKIIREAATEATLYNRKLSLESDKQLEGELKAKGIEFNRPDLAPFQAATKSVTEKWLKGPEGPFVKQVVDAAAAASKK